MSDAMTGDEHTCRICRGEATTKQPLIHPCKCRGSIRYIHEECLLEWLKHSSKLTKLCDICNTPYTFKTIYDPNMPKRVPLLLIRDKMVEAVVKTITKYVLFVLYALFVLQLPIFWKIIGRIYTFVIDGLLPSPGVNRALSLIYGTNIAYEKNLPLAPGSTWSDKAVYIFLNTFQSGLFQVALFVIMVLALFVEHEWVVRDEGYTRMLLNEMGTEPQSLLLDVLEDLQRRGVINEDGAVRRNGENAENAGDGGENDARNAQERPVLHPDQANAAIEYLREDLEEYPHEHRDRLREAIDNGTFDDLIQPEGADQPAEPELLIPRGAPAPFPDEDINDGGDIPDVPRGIQRLRQVNHGALPFRGMGPGYDGERGQEDNSDDELAEDEAENMGGVVDEEEEDEVDGAGALDGQFPDELDEGLLEIIGLKLNISTPLLLTLVVDLIVIAFLFAAYLIPHMVGNFILFLTALTMQIVVNNAKFIKPAKKLADYAYTALQPVNRVYLQSLVLTNAKFVTVDIFLKPFGSMVARCFSLTKTGPTTIFERVVALSIGYLLGCFAIHSAMKTMVAGKKPLTGNVRKLYKLLFELTATVKVFIVFAVEIVVFPVYCGWLIDMCLAPLFKHDLVIHNSDGSTTYDYLLILTNEKLGAPSTCVLIYWGFGTIYMLCFALYVGMLRTKILRPGVLFFIRSPEDPNARLIHDALVKSLRFQLLRIWLSAKFYTGNILLGIGLVTWGLRWLTMSPDPEKRVFLPIQIDWVGVLHIVSIGKTIMDHQTKLAEYCVMFWDRVFKVVCYKLRLSHFILGVSVPEERGYIVYKSKFHELRGDQPDYSHPVTLNEAKQRLKEPGINACFVPDGNYVRAPSSDTSRKFIDRLFIPVTKSDQPLLEAEPKPARPHEDGYESDYSDIDLNYEQSYDVVYRPPDFKARCMLLVLLLGIFAQILFTLVGTSAALIGRFPVNILTYIFEVLNLGWQPYDFDHSRADLLSLGYGIYFFVMLMCPDILGNEPLANVARPVRVPEGVNFDLNIRPWLLSSSWMPFVSHTGILVAIMNGLPQIERAILGASISDDFTNPNYYGIALYVGTFILAGSPLFISGLAEKNNQSTVRFLWTSGVFDDIAVWFVYLLLVRRGYLELLRPLLLMAVFVTVKVSLGGLRLLEYFNDQVKNEKYARGTAVQSIYLEDES